jgi:hypothetical protein
MIRLDVLPHVPVSLQLHVVTHAHAHAGTCGNILKNYSVEFKQGSGLAVSMFASGEGEGESERQGFWEPGWGWVGGGAYRKAGAAGEGKTEPE